ncbi:MAG: Fe-Mn family superoxide dismutase [bacterium]
MEIPKYEVQEQLKPSGLDGISDEQINDHWKLYEGYVKQSNQLNEDLKNLEEKGDGNSLLYADRKRRYGFEYNGMILHQYYFGNLKSNQKLTDESKLKKTIENQWGSFENWTQDFANTGKTRSIGWAILYLDPVTGNLTNHFIQEHGNGIIAGFVPILVMDIWEHAYMVDHKSGGRSDYIQAFMKNINWSKVEKRFTKSK